MSFVLLKLFSRAPLAGHFEFLRSAASSGFKVVVVTHAIDGRHGIRYLTEGIKVYYLPITCFHDRSTLVTFFTTLPLIRFVLLGKVYFSLKIDTFLILKIVPSQTEGESFPKNMHLCLQIFNLKVVQQFFTASLAFSDLVPRSAAAAAAEQTKQYKETETLRHL